MTYIEPGDHVDNAFAPTLDRRVVASVDGDDVYLHVGPSVIGPIPAARLRAVRRPTIAARLRQAAAALDTRWKVDDPAAFLAGLAEEGRTPTANALAPVLTVHAPLAEWLESVAADCDAYEQRWDDIPPPSLHRHATAVAHAVLAGVKL